MDKQRFGLRGALAVVLALGGAVGCSDDEDDSGAEPTVDAGGGGGGNETDAGGGGGETDAGNPDAPKDILETAAAAGSFNTLAKALRDTGLDAALKGDGPFTVFAPTDAAFAKLPAGTLESLTKEQLSGILTYHAVAGKVLAKDVKAGTVATLSGLTAFLGTEGGVTVNGVPVKTADVEASNGVIHVIETVLMPPDLVEAATLAGQFTTLLGAATKVDLVDTLTAADANLTVFAPTDAAFAKLPAGTVEGLTDDQLKSILLYHVVAGKVLAKDVKPGEVTTVNGAKVTVSVEGSTVKINESNVVLVDVVTTNGIIHVIDAVLLPPT